MRRILRPQSTAAVANRIIATPSPKTGPMPTTITPQTRGLLTPLASSLSNRFLSSSSFDENPREGNRSHIHFKLSPKGKALSPASLPSVDEEQCELASGDHTGRQQNHIWTKDEIDEALQTLYRHKPQSISDYVMNGFVSLILPSSFPVLILHRCMVHTIPSIL